MKENKTTYKYEIWTNRIGGTIDCLWWSTLINVLLALFMPALYDDNIGLRLFVVILTIIFAIASLEKLYLRPYLEIFMYIIFTDEEVPPLIYDDADMSEFDDE